MMIGIIVYDDTYHRARCQVQGKGKD